MTTQQTRIAVIGETDEIIGAGRDKAEVYRDACEKIGEDLDAWLAEANLETTFIKQVFDDGKWVNVGKVFY